MKKCIFILLILSIAMLSAQHVTRFAILGDRAGGVNQEAFEQIVQEVEIMKPDFVMTVGDIPDDCLPEEWEVSMKTLEQLSMHIYFTPGNNDIIDEETEKRFIENTKQQPNQSFDKNNIHFVIFDNSRTESWDEIGDEQKKWLEDDLRANRDQENIFVFMHKPFWVNGILAGKDDEMHKLFKEHNVDAVFTGHWHKYSYEYIDGIDYYMIGSSGGGFGSEDLEFGRFYHFAWCTVNADKLDLAVIESGSIYGRDLVYMSESEVKDNLFRKYIKGAAICNVTGDGKAVYHVSVTNPGKGHINEVVTAETPENWSAAPGEFAIELKPGEKKDYEIELSKTGSFFPLPRLKMNFPVSARKIARIDEPIKIVPVIETGSFQSSPTIDGKIDADEWAGATMLLDFCNFDGEPSLTGETKVYFASDKENIYIAAECYQDTKQLVINAAENDGVVYKDDCVGFLISPSDKEGYQIYINPKGIVWDMKANLETWQSDMAWNVKGEIKAGVGENMWTAEIMIPLSEFGEENVPDRLKLNIRRKQQDINESALFTPEWSFDLSGWGQLRIQGE